MQSLHHGIILNNRHFLLLLKVQSPLYQIYHHRHDEYNISTLLPYNLLKTASLPRMLFLGKKVPQIQKLDAVITGFDLEQIILRLLPVLVTPLLMQYMPFFLLLYFYKVIPSLHQTFPDQHSNPNYQHFLSDCSSLINTKIDAVLPCFIIA